MAKRERNKRAARKARQQERERVAEAQAAAASGKKEESKSLFKKSNKSAAKKTTAVAKADRKGLQVVTGYFSDIRYEMHQVTWPTRVELRNYSLAVIAALIVFGVVIWLVDTGFVAGLVQYTGLRG
ncbi:MAG: preprotein translocase subunit SecE [Atopobiaceae bacterium]|nr:preprotein translocase subunit SecE [Atopobiaceae bacterium]